MKSSMIRCSLMSHDVIFGVHFAKWRWQWFITIVTKTPGVTRKAFFLTMESVDVRLPRCRFVLFFSLLIFFRFPVFVLIWILGFPLLVGDQSLETPLRYSNNLGLRETVRYILSLVAWCRGSAPCDHDLYPLRQYRFYYLSVGFTTTLS